MRYLNVRGINGSGKTTLLRNLATSTDGVRVVETITPEGKSRPIPGTILPSGVALLGDYTTPVVRGADWIARQGDIKNALVALGTRPDVEVTVFESVIVSTIFEPWLIWERHNGGMVWAFLNTPVRVCRERVSARNGGAAINEELFVEKVHKMQRIRRKARDAYYDKPGRVVDLRYDHADEDLALVLAAMRA
jgi:hypothetical protein